MMSLSAIAHALGGNVSGDQVLAPGPGHSPKDRSLSVKPILHAPDGFVVHSFAGDDPIDCRDYVREKLGLEHHRASFRASNETFRGSPRPGKHRFDPDGAWRTARALDIWHEAVDIEGTVAVRYLATRKLPLPQGVSGRVLRFHPNCPFGRGRRSPALVALYTSIRDNVPKAIHRTALTPNGHKLGRMVLGPKAGCAIKLTADEAVTDGLAIGEGLETTLAGMALGFTPAWAVGDARSIGSLPVLSGIEALTVFVDADESETGQQRARECSARWTAAGREVLRIVPTHIGEDLADIGERRPQL